MIMTGRLSAYWEKKLTILTECTDVDVQHDCAREEAAMEP